MAGSGLHVHVSLLDERGGNVFACEQPNENPRLLQAIAGTLATLADGVAICAPGPNSYRRFRPEAYVPMQASWSINNRSAAIRIPVSDAANRRVEHRLAGADSNPYLVMAWVLAGIHHGMSNQLVAPPALIGNAYAQVGETLPAQWDTAIERFSASRVAKEYLGEGFTNLFATVKRGELADFSSYVTPLEMQWYLGPL
jgi:glutamine synthetase